MSARGGTKTDLLRTIRNLQAENTKLRDALGELCDWVGRETGEYPSDAEQFTTPHAAWRVYIGDTSSNVKAEAR